jgi:hypothetical protein
MQGANAVAAEAAGAVGDLILDTAGREHRAVTTLQVGLGQAALPAPLAAGQLLA